MQDDQTVNRTGWRVVVIWNGCTSPWELHGIWEAALQMQEQLGQLVQKPCGQKSVT